MLKLASKFAMDVFPSVIATILGAYIVQHYINIKQPAADTPAAAMSTANPKKATSKVDSKPAERSADLGNAPDAGVRAKGISEKAISEKSMSEKAAAEKAASEKAAAEKAAAEKATDKADRPAETASIPPAETRRHQPTPREKAASKTLPASNPAPEPVVAAAPAAAAPAEPTPDANDLARAAIERLRGTEPRGQESARAAEKTAAPAATASVPVAATPSTLQPLPPPILVSAPPVENKPPARADDPFRPRPPADIPDAQQGPLDLRADAGDQQPPPKRPSVADDVLSAAKSMFNSVLPK